MIRGLFMMPMRGMSIVRGFLVIARLMVFGGFLVMTRGVSILCGRFLVLLRSLGRHDFSFPGSHVSPAPCATSVDAFTREL